MSVVSSWLSDHDVIHLRTLVVALLLGLLIDSHVRIRRLLATWIGRWKISRLVRRCVHSNHNQTSNNEDSNDEQQQHDSTTRRTVSGIYYYPVKSLRGVSLSCTKLDDRGLVNDRRFMVVCENPPSMYGIPLEARYRFVTQRQCPALATIDATLSGSTLTLSHGGQSVRVEVDTLMVPNNNTDTTSRRSRARIWEDIVDVIDAGDEAAIFLQPIVGMPGTRLVAMDPSDTSRVANDAYVPPEARSLTGGLPMAGLTDGFPILVACTASLKEVNRRLVEKGKDPIPMSRFRPNVVIETTVPFEEDHWKVIQIREEQQQQHAILHLVKGCPRCKQSCTDQQSGVVSDEPLATLADFRALGHTREDVYFAQNAVPHTIGSVITVGSTVHVLKRGNPVWDKEKVKAE